MTTPIKMLVLMMVPYLVVRALSAVTHYQPSRIVISMFVALLPSDSVSCSFSLE